MTPAMIVLVWTRVRRAEVAFLALVARVVAGRYRGGGLRTASVSASVREDAVRAVRVSRGCLPLRFGWLMTAMPYEAAGYASQLRTILEEPEMAAILRDVAQARRILGPVCRMLGVEIPGVGAGVRAPVARAPVVRVSKKRVQPVWDMGRVPLPRGVLTAARRQGFGKMR